MVYLLHFDRKYEHAQHYIGFTDDLPSRIACHRAGHGARLVEVITEAGIGFTVARTWDGGRELERQLKSWKKARQLCPVCSPRALRHANY